MGQGYGMEWVLVYYQFLGLDLQGRMAEYQDQWDRDDYGEEDDDREPVSLDDDEADEGELGDGLKNEEDDDGDSDQDDNNGSQSSSEASNIFKNTQTDIQILDNEPLFPQPNPTKITNPYLSKYERAAILGKRAEQIASNSPIYVHIDWDQQKLPDAMEVAQMEFKEGKIPFIVRRWLPDGGFQDWRLQEFWK